jgi:alkylated DNA repair dioxygenase AlkB
MLSRWAVHSGERNMRQTSPDLFNGSSSFPPGFRYQPELIEESDERRLLQEMEKLHFKPFEFQGFIGKRLIVSFGWRYDFNGGGLQKTEDVPDFLLPIRNAAAAFASMDASRLQHVLLTQYPPGAAIGWHKDRSVFGQVVGISLLSVCTFRFRKQAGKKWERRLLVAEPRSAYLLDGPSRTEWEHSIPAVEELRYSVTFRNLREDEG